jgi:serpin B
MNDIEPDELHFDEAAVRTLRVLGRRTPVTTGWRAPDTVRRTAVRRRRTRWSAGAAAVLGAAVATALSLGGAGRTGGTAAPGTHLSGQVHTLAGPNGSVQLVADTSPVTGVASSKLAAVVAAEQRLSLALLNQVGTGSNVTVSPASLYVALGMLQNGARGTTADEISHALQASGISTDDQNAGLAALTASLAAGAAKDSIEFDSANSLWQQKGFPVKQQFLDALAAYYKSGVWQVDYARHMADALAAINAWTSDKTRGKITELFDHLDPLTVLVLANAIYFHADWQTPFDKNETEPGAFTTADGKHVTVQYMKGGTGLRAGATSDYKAVALPYRGERFEALAVMPTTSSLTDFVQSLTPDEIGSIDRTLQSGVSVGMPRFTTASTTDLNPVLQALGMHRAFSNDADLSGLSDTPTYVNQVVQRDYLQVGELGTTAAAATGVGVSIQSLTITQVELDHPFLFLVRDTQTGAILFASEITDPSA